MDTSFFIPPLRITLAGGGIKGLAHIGALEVLSERGYLKAVREYIGISAGALCAFCLCVGCSLTELRTIAERLDFGLVRDLEPEAILTFPDSFGLDTGANLEKLLRAILREKHLPMSLTFEDLHSRGIGPALRIFATDLNTCRVTEFSAAVTPTADIVSALRASMCIPIYFTPVRHPLSGNLLVDGGVISHSPFKFISEDERQTTLCICFHDEHKPREVIDSLPTFLLQLYYALDYQYNQELIENRDHQVLSIQCGRFNSLNFEAGLEQKRGLLEAGRQGALAFLARFVPGRPVNSRCPPRRFSVS